MASFFGEVRQTYSRAYDEEDEDPDSETPWSTVKVELSAAGEDLIPQCEMLIISYGTMATDFCETLLSEKCTEAGTIKTESCSSNDLEDTGDFHARHVNPSRLFTTKQLGLVCCISKDVTPSVAVQFAQKLLGLVKSTCLILVLSSHHYSALQGNYEPEGEDNCVIHSLCSPAFSTSPVYSPLPQPATLDSVPAAVLTECIVARKPCVAYPVFTETYSTGDLDLVLDPIMKIFQKEPFKKVALSAVDKNKLHQYRTERLHKEPLDRYM